MSLFLKFLSRAFGWLIAVAGFLCLAVPLAWATPGHLLFEFAVGRRAHWVGGRLRGVRNLGALVLPPT